MWMLAAKETVPGDLDAQVAGILSQLTSDEPVWAALSDRYKVELYCGWFMRYSNEGVSIAPETMSALGTRGIFLDIDLYRGGGHETPD